MFPKNKSFLIFLSFFALSLHADPLPAQTPENKTPPAAAPAQKTEAPDIKSQDWPRLTLEKDGLSLLIALPDPEKGFYRGSRFDHSSMIYEATVDGTILYGPWKNGFKRGGGDSVTGPAGEFGMDSPLGYDEAAPGENFIKIGVGHLTRKDDKKYFFAHGYALAHPGTWKLEQGENFVEVQHELPELRGWNYSYTKRITLEPGKQMAIVYTLKNTGSKTIETVFYNHNLLTFNQTMVGPAHRFTLPFPITPLLSRLRDHAQIQENSILFTDNIVPNKGYYAELDIPPGFEKGLINTISHQESQLSVQLTIDYRPGKLVFYAHDKTMCVEPFLNIKLAPGETQTWTDRYQFIKNDAVASTAGK
ncbi:MAG: hypothetical protein HC904_00470 [Blastochloris sp.]|nr:hypothetical protein [Blastochloris sp.]